MEQVGRVEEDAPFGRYVVLLALLAVQDNELLACVGPGLLAVPGPCQRSIAGAG